MPGGDLQVTLEGVDLNRVFYLLDNSLPFDSGGYAVRSHGLIKGIAATGTEIAGITRLGYPDARKEPNLSAISEIDEFDNATYRRLLNVSHEYERQYRFEYIRNYIEELSSLIRTDKPLIIHGASTFINGVTANYISRQFHLKSIYEVRGLWEITRLSRDPHYARSKAFRRDVRMETEACLHADRVICITGALRDEIVSRGVDPDKITIVPNGVHTDRFVPRPPDVELAAEMGLSENDVVVGYIGSVVDYEGLDDLLRALRLVIDAGHANVKLIVVGDGSALASCRELSKRLALGNNVVFTGRVLHYKVEQYYSLISIAPFPRKPLPVCEMVSPLKPFEAMAMEKCVVVSSVAALKEIVEHGRTGLVYTKGDCQSLAETLKQAIDNRNLRLELGREARRWVAAHRDWNKLGARVAEIYEELRREYTDSGNAPLSKRGAD